MAGEGCPQEWKVVKLGDLGEVNRGRSRHRPRYAAHLYGGPYPFVQTGDIKISDGRITTYQQTYSEAGLTQSRLWPAETMCITIAANIAETGILTFPACFPDSVVGFIADKSKCDIYFIEYMFRYLRRRIQHEANGSVQDNINLGTLDRLRFPCPPLPEQRAIAHILGTLDDKIELNRRMNETLEAMMQALFKNWFVDFEPFRDQGTQDSSLGPIPRGWRVESIYSVADVIYGAPFASKLFNSNRVGFPLLRIRDLATHKPDICTSERHPKQTIVNPGDIVVGMDGEFRVHHWRGEPALLNQRVCIFRPKKAVPRVFVSASITERMAFFERSKVGTTVIHLGKSDIDTIRIMMPPEPILESFGRETEPLIDRVIANEAESSTLAAIRDALLPKLLSGEIRVKDAERFAERAA